MQEVFPVFYINHHFLPGLPTGETFWGNANGVRCCELATHPIRGIIYLSYSRLSVSTKLPLSIIFRIRSAFSAVVTGPGPDRTSSSCCFDRF